LLVGLKRGRRSPPTIRELPQEINTQPATYQPTPVACYLITNQTTKQVELTNNNLNVMLNEKLLINCFYNLF
jgi:hypothetical protein